MQKYTQKYPRINKVRKYPAIVRNCLHPRGHYRYYLLAGLLASIHNPIIAFPFLTVAKYIIGLLVTVAGQRRTSTDFPFKRHSLKCHTNSM